MTSRLRKAFINNLQFADWMDYDTKQSAKEKVQRSQNIIRQIHGWFQYLIIYNLQLVLFNFGI